MELEEDPLVSFVTICYNGLADTCALIDSIQSVVHSVTYEIIVVDNASRENEAAAIQARYPSVIALRNSRNAGFAGGNNLGIWTSRGRYVFLINNDTYLEDDGLPILIDRIESRPEIGAVSPKIRFAYPPQKLQFAGFTPMSRITLRNKSIGCGTRDTGQYNVAHSTPFLHGAAMFVKREVIERVGYMPEIYFLYYEELDWCSSITRTGYTLWYEPRCVVFHKESQSTGRRSTLRTYYLTRNRLLYAWRNRNGTECLLSITYQITFAAVINSLKYLLMGRPRHIGAIWRGIIDFANLPHKTKK